MAIFTEKELWASNGHPKTRSLFKEVAMGDDVPLMTLGRGNEDEFICLQTLYVNLCTDDPSEVTFVDAVFGDYTYWERLSKARWFQPYLNAWRREADVRRKSKAFKAIIEEVETKGRNSFQAAKFLIGETYKDKRNPEVKKEVDETTKAAKEEFSSDLVRLEEYLK